MGIHLSNKSKIVHILYSGLGGHSSVFFSLINGDKNKTFDQVPFFCGIEELNPDNVKRCLEKDIRYRYFRKRKGLDLQVYWKIFKELRLENPAVVFLHGAGFIIPALLYKLLNRNAKLLLRDTQAANLKTRSEWLFLMFSHLFVSRNIFLSQESIDSLKNKMGRFFISRKVACIPNGTILHSPAVSTESPDYRKVIRLAMQGRLQPIKDHPTLILAFKNIVKKNPAHIFYLDIIGDGATMVSLKTMVKDLSLTDHVFFYGMVGTERLQRLMNEVDIYIHATHGETMSNSLLETMAFALPIIASDVWGVNNLLKDGKTGLLYTPQDVDDLTQKISYLIDNRARALQLGMAAFREIDRNYSSKLMYERYEKIFIEYTRSDR